MGVRRRWIALLHRAATGTRRTRTLLTPVGVVVFFGFTAAFVAAGVLVDEALGLTGLLPTGVKVPVSAAVMLVGAAVTIWSAGHFLRVRGTPVPFNPPPEVVDTGPYRYVRNPMLSGVFLLLVGVGLAIDSASLVLVFVPLFILVNVWELRNIEEPELVERLGDEYLAYRARTPMFIPRLWRRRRPKTVC